MRFTQTTYFLALFFLPRESYVLRPFSVFKKKNLFLQGKHSSLGDSPTIVTIQPNPSVLILCPFSYQTLLSLKISFQHLP